MDTMQQRLYLGKAEKVLFVVYYRCVVYHGGVLVGKSARDVVHTSDV